MFLCKVHCFFGAKNVANHVPTLSAARFACRTSLANKNTGLPTERQARKYCCALKNRLSCDKGLKQLLTGAARATSRLRFLLD